MVRVASEWLATCGGCEITILDIGEPLLDLLPQLQFVHMPVIMDHKYYGQTGEMEFNIPEADVGLISGSIRNEENARVAQEMRKKCKTLIAVGSCANFGGIPALANMFTLQEMLDTVYRKTRTTVPADNPSMDIPPLRDRVYSVSEVVKVDLGLPGCPTTPELMAQAIVALLEGKPFEVWDGGQKRDFTYVDDAVDATVAAATAAGAAGQTINVGSGQTASVLEVLSTLSRLLGLPPIAGPPPEPTSLPGTRQPQASRAAELLGYVPRVSLVSGLSRVVQSLTGYQQFNDPALAEIGADE